MPGSTPIRPAAANRSLTSLFALLLSVSMLLLVAACASAPTATPVAPVVPNPPTPIPQVLATPPTPDKSLGLKACVINGINAECGYLHVPEDRNNPGGRTLELWMVVVRADGPSRAPDPVFYLAGGPGDYATAAVATAHNLMFGKVNAQRDLVFLDQRGTNDKHRLTCEYPSFAIADAPQSQVNDWMKQCLAGLGGDPRFYTTAAAMRDLDQARAALGYDKINLYGMSYGVTAAQVYMRMFPEHFRAAVLDHGTALDVPFIQALPGASQSALDRIFTYCEQDETCHAACPNIRGDWQAVLDRLARGPVVTSFVPAGGTTPAEVTLEAFVDAIHELLKSTGDYEMIPRLVHGLASNQDWTQVLKSFDQQHARSSGDNEMLLMQEVIYCFEPAWGYDAQAIARLDPGLYYRNAEVAIAKREQKTCAALPKPDASLIYSPGKPAALSALMLNSLLDPQNPPANMELALKEFPQSRMIVEPTEGHHPTQTGCHWEIITQYIQNGSLDGLNTACIDQQKPSFLIGN